MIVLTTFNARYAHSAFGLRYLAANLGEFADEARIMEYTLQADPEAVAEALAAANQGDAPEVIGIGVYIWNVAQSRALLGALRARLPNTTVVLGGPEVSHELETQPWTRDAHYIIQGEGETAFLELCRRLRDGKRPLQRVIAGGTPELETLTLPYALYTDEDLARRTLYVEASRGCPYRCEFCLSSLDKKVRPISLDALLEAFDRLIERGARHFKFVDRTFNLDLARSRAILDFFAERYRPGMFLHFEMVPDRLPEALRGPLASFPEGAVQLEIGIQSLDPEVGRRIQRRQDLARTFDNLAFLTGSTGVHIHADLIVGLPGEDVASFGQGFDRLFATGVDEIQVGILKRLRGTPIARHAEAFEMRFDPEPPYAVQSTRDIDADAMYEMTRFALAWDVFVNRGRFVRSAPRIWGDRPPFTPFMAFVRWHLETSGRVHGVDLLKRARLLATYLIEVEGQDEDGVLGALAADLEAGRVPLPRWLKHAGAGRKPDRRRDPAPASASIPDRQARHLRAAEPSTKG